MADGALLDRRIGVRVTGAVQGVGFRPFVYRLARDLGLSGFVLNDSDGVWIEAQGARVDQLPALLRAQAPPLSRIAGVDVTPLPWAPARGFEVRASQNSDPNMGGVSARIPADAGVCDACVDDVFEPGNRRHLYPFTACCHCGPRYTMTRALPYDRAQTAMAAFPLCEACSDEYHDPASRRFHAEPTCCAACGPRYSEDAGRVASRLLRGDIIAIKGIGGFHIMADARNADAIARLRAAKERSDKPFAVMVANIASARWIAHISEDEAGVLQSPARPIVVCAARDASLDPVAPGLGSLGVMLPATPMHWLLFWHALGCPTGVAWRAQAHSMAFICTSANRSGEPLAIDGESARTQLSGLVDAIIDHDRDIVVRADDPVVRMIARSPTVLRRGRGQTPEPIMLPADVAPTLAFGGHLKAAVCVARGREAFLAQHVGDLDDAETIAFYKETIERLCAITGVRPQRVACDAHPDFVSTRLAEQYGARLVRVQHHHAHAAACAAENRVDHAHLALVLDGYGYGDDGAAWGGEILRVDGASCVRVGGLAPLWAPGGDRAARDPWRMAAGALHAMGRGDEIVRRFGDQTQATAVQRLLQSGRSAQTSSCGRLFDAAAALFGVCDEQGYEAEAAMRLEALARDDAGSTVVGEAVKDGVRDAVFEPWPLLQHCMDLPPAQAASVFHAGLAQGLAQACAHAARQSGLATIALSGGCMANAILVKALIAALRAHGLTPLTHRVCPPGDGGLALGQAWIAGRLREESQCA